jgi:hypothetical protein
MSQEVEVLHEKVEDCQRELVLHCCLMKLLHLNMGNVRNLTGVVSVTACMVVAAEIPRLLVVPKKCPTDQIMGSPLTPATPSLLSKRHVRRRHWME